MVACSRWPAPSAQVPPLTVGTAEEPSIVNFLPLRRSTTVADAACCSCRSWRTTTAHESSSSASETCWRGAAVIVTEAPFASRRARVPASSTLRVAARPRVTVSCTEPGAGDQSSRSRPASRASGSADEPTAAGRPADARGVPAAEGVAVALLEDGEVGEGRDVPAARSVPSALVPAQPPRPRAAATSSAAPAAYRLPGAVVGRARIRRRCCAGSGRGSRGSSCRRRATAPG